MISESTREEVRQHLIDSERLIRYYADLSDKYGKRANWIRGSLYFAAVAGMMSPYWAMTVSPFISIGVGGVLAIIITVDFVLEPGKKSVLLYGISIQCDRLNDEWQNLWIDIQKEGIDGEMMIRRIGQLAQLETSVTSGLGYAGIPQDLELNNKCHQEALEYMRSRYVEKERVA